MTSGVSVNLAAGTASNGYGGTDTLVKFENVTGSAFNDVIYAGPSGGVINGGLGNDVLVAGAGADTLIGGGGNDNVNYVNSTAGVAIDLGAGTASGGYAQGDTLVGIANVYGSAFNDMLTDDGGNNLLVGGGGADIYRFGRGGGQDEVVNGSSANSGATGELDFGSGVAADQLWFKQSGNDLIAQIMGTHDQITIASWFSSTSSQLSEITTSDGSKLDTELAQLVQAIETDSAANAGFDPSAVTQAPGDADGKVPTLPPDVIKIGTHDRFDSRERLLRKTEGILLLRRRS